MNLERRNVILGTSMIFGGALALLIAVAILLKLLRHGAPSPMESYGHVASTGIVLVAVGTTMSGVGVALVRRARRAHTTQRGQS